LLQST
jgi:hypothetical protein